MEPLTYFDRDRIQDDLITLDELITRNEWLARQETNAIKKAAILNTVTALKAERSSLQLRLKG